MAKGEDYITYIDDGSFKVTDFNIVHDIRKLLTDSGIHVVAGPPTSVPPTPTSKNVIVISAHSDVELAKFIDALGGAGAFRNNFVILNSCETSITERIAARITQAYGANAVYVHEGPIPASEVQESLVSLTSAIQREPKAGLVDTLRRIMGNLGLNGVWSICDELLLGAGRMLNG